MNFKVRSGVATSVIVGVVVLVIVVAAAGAYFAFSSGGSSSGSTSNASSSSTTSTAGSMTTTSTSGPQSSSTTTSTSSTLPTTATTSSTSSASSASSTSSTVSTSTTYSTLSCASTTSTSTTTTTDYTPKYIGLIQQFSAMEFRVSGIVNGTQSNETLSYMVTSNSGGIYVVNFTESGASGGIVASFMIDSSNATVLSVSYFGQTLHGSEAKPIFDSFMALFGLEYTYGGAMNVYTSSAYFKSTGTTSMTFGTATFPVTTYVANSLPETVNECGVNSTLTAYTLGVGTPQGTSLQFITYLHVAGTDNSDNSTFDDTFQLVSMTVG